MVKLSDDPVSWFAEHSGIHKTIVKKYFAELEKAGLDWQSFDVETIAEEIKDFGQTGGRLEHPELRKRLGLPRVVEKTAEKQSEEQEIEGLLGDKAGVKQLLRRIYENKGLSDKQKEELKEKIIAGSPETATLIALYDGKEQDYAKEFLREMVLSPVAEIRDLLRGDTLKVKSSRGWVKEVNDVPLKKPVRSIDLVGQLQGFDVVSSQPEKDFTVSLYSRKPKLVYQKGLEPGLVQAEFPVAKAIKKEEEKKPVVVKTEAAELDYYGMETKDRPHLESFAGKELSEAEIEAEKKELVKEWQEEMRKAEEEDYVCSVCGSPLSFQQYWYEDCPRCGKSAYERLRAEQKEEVSEKEEVTRISKPEPQFREQPVPATDSLAKDIGVEQKAQRLIVTMGYDEVKQLVRQQGKRYGGSKYEMVIRLIRDGIL